VARSAATYRTNPCKPSFNARLVELTDWQLLPSHRFCNHSNLVLNLSRVCKQLNCGSMYLASYACSLLHLQSHQLFFFEPPGATLGAVQPLCNVTPTWPWICPEVVFLILAAPAGARVMEAREAACRRFGPVSQLCRYGTAPSESDNLNLLQTVCCKEPCLLAAVVPAVAAGGLSWGRALRKCQACQTTCERLTCSVLRAKGCARLSSDFLGPRRTSSASCASRLRLRDWALQPKNLLPLLYMQASIPYRLGSRRSGSNMLHSSDPGVGDHAPAHHPCMSSFEGSRS